MANPVEKEIWKNVAPGMRHYIALNAIGEQTSKTVNSGKTFTISPIERQLNQEAVYDSKVDPFRDGTFLLVRGTSDTIVDEIESPNSVTDAEIETVIREALGGDTVPYEAMLSRIDGMHTAQRIFEEAVAADLAQSLVDMARGKVDSLKDLPVDADGNPIVVGERQVVAAAGLPAAAKKQNWTVRVE